ncbi:uncharacterized protein LOC127710329 [Mytilus californianus]|uniref:uncharacterized protein LOC127710329 n=1 Tax=Mytilus californianus TaxID=6549 RepID=UPI002245C07E|nr:uncharacterized protein LOC127710329 [Mytilus californianus]
MLPPITVPVRQRLDLSTVAGAPNAVNNQDPPQVSQNNSAGTRSTLSTPRRRRLSTPRRPRRSTAIRSGTQEQENNAELNQSSIIDVQEETPPEVVAAGYRTATGDSPTVLFRTSAPLMVDQMNTHSISIPNQTNRSQQIIDITSYSSQRTGC